MTITYQVNYHLKAQCAFVINFVNLFYMKTLIIKEVASLCMKSYGFTIQVKPQFSSIFTWYYSFSMF